MINEDVFVQLRLWHIVAFCQKESQSYVHLVRHPPI